METATKKADVVVLMTPRRAFREINLRKVHELVQPRAIVLDTRGFWSKDECESAGFEYLGVGRPD